MLDSVFPTELYERIIDYVGQAVDSPTLRVCALVSRTWYPRARLHLVRSVRLVDRQEVLAFTNMIRGGHGPLGLTDARGMVERLIVRGVESESNQATAKGAEKKTRRSLVHLGTCAAMLAGRARLDNLTYLGIAEGDWRGLHPKIGMHLNAAFPRLRWLDLYNVQFLSTPDFGRFLCAFACLQQASVWVPARGQNATQNPSSTPFDPAAFIDDKTNGM
ncbi:hypothetical protein DAEQUDRAFT_389361 [Daedalea quercina L-15889]|uniref:F-box domain-containing protein n=1 Tax=Daedalea quercina L-15889 TaxID=1314783 RepID=A0A165NZH0_9APHY|nr:hypothetical protein DAEQUDRAFT_389361 [Daedalea quercina L-15889]